MLAGEKFEIQTFSKPSNALDDQISIIISRKVRVIASGVISNFKNANFGVNINDNIIGAIRSQIDERLLQYINII